MGKPLVHVLVINWNGQEHLYECFDALCQNTYANARFVLVDNGSTDSSVDLVRNEFGHDPRVEILECGANLGWSGGNNRGMEHALTSRAGYVFLLNNDTAVAPDCIEQLVSFAEAHPAAGGVAPKMLLFDQPDIINSIGVDCSLVGVGWDIGLGRVDGPAWCEPRRVLGLCGGACLIRCEALHKTGLLPEDFDIYLDDLDLSLRLWDVGYEVWSCPAATVLHKFSATMGEGANLRRKYYRNTRNRLRLILRNFPASSIFQVCPAYLLAEAKAVGRALLGRELWRVWSHVRSWFAGLAYVPKAMTARREAQTRILKPGSFWPLVRKDLLFFPGIELPTGGWYRARYLRGAHMRPMARTAWVQSLGGSLRVSHANCYPRIAQTEVEIRAGERLLAVLTTLDSGCMEFEVPAGMIEFVSRRIFTSEETGEGIDIGGWIRIEES
ncbi:MAG: glycosyltransferase family 2 protein [Candidatus Hydrogenedentes bacterium]|nr:glycosyltransferase family 2 protein [Candidatus Hydrogenedentota bacterium]